MAKPFYAESLSIDRTRLPNMPGAFSGVSNCTNLLGRNMSGGSTHVDWKGVQHCSREDKLQYMG